MKILLISPPYYKLFGSHNNRVNIGLFTISEILKKNNFNPSILNLDSSRKKSLINRATIFKNSQKPNKNSIINAKKNLKKYILMLNPECILFSIGDITNPSVDLASHEIAEKLALYVKKKYPDIFKVAVGPHVQESKVFDLVLFGNPEKDICHYIKKRKTGYHHVNINNKALEKLPFINLHDSITQVKPHDFDYIWQSRGCTYDCTFCSNPIISNKKITYRSPKRFVDEIEFRHNKYQVSNFYFTDPTFNHDSNNLAKVCNEITKRGLPITYRCECRVDILNHTQIKNLKKSGCTHIKLGIEAMNNARLNFLGKGFHVETVLKKIAMLKSYDINFVVYIMLGHPNYSNTNYLKEYKLFKALDATQYTVSILNPSYKTELMKDSKFFSSPEYLSNSHLNFKAAKYWKLSPKILNLFYNLELEKGREDSKIRTIKH